MGASPGFRFTLPSALRGTGMLTGEPGVPFGITVGLPGAAIRGDAAGRACAGLAVGGAACGIGPAADGIAAAPKGLIHGRGFHGSNIDANPAPGLVGGFII